MNKTIINIAKFGCTVGSAALLGGIIGYSLRGLPASKIISIGMASGILLSPAVVGGIDHYFDTIRTHMSIKETLSEETTK